MDQVDEHQNSLIWIRCVEEWNSSLRAWKLKRGSNSPLVSGDIVVVQTNSWQQHFLIIVYNWFFYKVNAIATQAAQLGAKVICFTPDSRDRLPFSAHVVRVPSACYPWMSDTTVEPAGDEDAGCFPLTSEDTGVLQASSSYEMSLWLALECVCVMLQRLSSVSDADMRAKHTNLE